MGECDKEMGKMYAKKEGRKIDDVVEYQRRVMEKIKTLSLERLKVVLDFIEYLEEKEELEATLEVLKDEETMENIKAADDAWEAGRIEEFMPWEKVRGDVQNTYSQESSNKIYKELDDKTAAKINNAIDALKENPFYGRNIKRLRG